MARGRSRMRYRGYKGGRASTASRGPKKPPLTHFLCFPLVTSTSRPQFELSLSQFQFTISTPSEPSIQTSLDTNGPPFTSDVEKQLQNPLSTQSMLPPKAIRPIGTLHLTLGVMSLETEERIQGAIDLLEALDPRKLLEDTIAHSHTDRNIPTDEASKNDSVEADVSSTPTLTSLSRPISPPPTSRPPAPLPTGSVEEPIIISLTSLISMHAPTKTSILYAAPHDASNRLLPLSQLLRTIFEENEYLAKDTRPLKLHATIVNTIYAKSGGRYSRPNAAPGQSSTSKPEASADQGETGAPNEDPEELNDPNDAGEFKTEERASGYGPNTRAPLRFDATALIERFKEFVWARDIRIEKVAICKMGAKKILDGKGEVVGEEYEEVASLALP